MNDTESRQPSGPERPRVADGRAVAREDAIIEAFVDLADSLVANYDPLDFLHRLLDHSLPLTGADDGAVLLSYEGRLHLVASSTERSEHLQLIELQAEHGPAREAFRTGGACLVDIAADGAELWPDFARESAPFGWSCAYAVPLRLRDHIAGSFVVFWSASPEPRPSEGDALLLQGLADVATIAVMQQRATADVTRINEQLHHALDSRIKVEQAKGMLAHATGLPLGAAFDLMRQHARSTNQILQDVARAVVAGDLDLASP